MVNLYSSEGILIELWCFGELGRSVASVLRPNSSEKCACHYQCYRSQVFGAYRTIPYRNLAQTMCQEFSHANLHSVDTSLATATSSPSLSNNYCKYPASMHISKVI